MPFSRLVRGISSSLALLGVGVGIGWLLFGARPEIEPAPGDLVPGPVASAAPEAPILQGRAPVSPRPDLAVGPDSVPLPATEEAVAPPGTVAGRIEVTLVLPEWTGRQAVSGVYALPAGAAGVPKIEMVPNDQKLLGEQVVLSLPRAGTWDVFLAARGTAGAVLDVEVPAGATVPVRLAPYPSAPIRFRLEGGLPEDWPTDWTATVTVRAPPTSERIEFPGRHEHLALQATAAFDAHGVATTKPLPAGRTYDVEVYPVRMILETRGRTRRIRPRGGPFALMAAERRTEAGATVAVRVLRRGAVRLGVQLDHAPPPSWAQWTRFVLRVQVEAEGGSGDHGWVRVTPNADPAVAASPVLWGDPGPARVTWKGAGFLPGATERFQLEPGGTIEREITLRIDPAFAPSVASPPRPEGVVRVQVEGWTEPVGGSDLVLFGLSKHADGTVSCHNQELDNYPLVSTYYRDNLPVEEVWAIRAPDLVSRRMPVPPAGELRVDLEPGGHLMIVCDRISPPGMGALVLRRSDGRPFPVLATVGSGEAPSLVDVGCRLVIEPGWLVGPLLEGAHRFEITLGGVRLPDVTAHVRAGRVEVLRVLR